MLLEGLERAGDSPHGDQIFNSVTYKLYYIHSIYWSRQSEGEGYTVWSKHIHTGRRNAGRRHSFVTLKMYKVFSKSYRKQTKQASLFC